MKLCVHIAALVIEHLMLTKDQFRERVLRHYVRQGKLQVYKMVGTADIIGNPVALVEGVSCIYWAIPGVNPTSLAISS